MPDTISYNAAISACEKASAWTYALNLLSDMRREGLEPDSLLLGAAISAFSAAISACKESLEWTNRCDAIN